LFLDSTDTKGSLDEELEATHRAGIKSTELISKVPNLSFDTGPCLLFPNQAQFHPLKYLKGLSEAILCYGGKIYTETHVQDIIFPNEIKTSDGYTAFAKNIVIATNAPIIDKVKFMKNNKHIEHMLLERESKKTKFPMLFIGIPVIKIQKIQLHHITMSESNVMEKMTQSMIY